jgi:hypothetical protein
VDVGQRPGAINPAADRALEILRERYARGEITREECFIALIEAAYRPERPSSRAPMKQETSGEQGIVGDVGSADSLVPSRRAGPTCGSWTPEPWAEVVHSGLVYQLSQIVTSHQGMALLLLYTRPMASLLRRHIGTSGLVSVAVLATVIAFAAGSCLAGTHTGSGHDHGISVDVCLGMIGIANAVAPLIVLFAAGSAIVVLSVAVLPAPVHVLDPPPRFIPLR